MITKSTEMYDRAVTIAIENKFECLDVFWYSREDDNSVLGLKIQPWVDGSVLIQFSSVYGYIGESEPMIFSPLNKALLESVIKAFAFADMAVIQSIKEA